MKKIICITLGITILLSSFTTRGMLPKGLDSTAGIEVLYSGVDDILLEMTAPDYHIEEVSLATGSFDLISIPGTVLTSEPGEPALPVFNALIGIPPDGEISIEILSKQSSKIPGTFSISPAPRPLRLENDLEAGRLAYFPNEELYRTDTLYPESTVRIEEEGWLRDQRIARIAFYPIQYNPAQGTLTWHRQIRVKVAFEGGLIGGESFPHVGDVTSGSKKQENVENPFEPVLKHSLLNYETATAWRRSEIPDQDTQPDTFGIQTQAIKITVDQDGLYRITYDDLDDAGFNLAEVDPRNLHMTNQGQDVAISIHGEEDGVFDTDDYITFYGEYFRGDRLEQIYADEDLQWQDYFVYIYKDTVYFDAQLNATMFEKYTDENVYWLMEGNKPGPRMGEVDGTPGDPGDVETPEFYWETVHREEQNIWWSYHFMDEDTWLWEKVIASGTTPVTHTYTATLSALASVPVSATMQGEVNAYTYDNFATPDHHTQFFINDESNPFDDATWDGHVSYTLDAEMPQANLQEGENELHFVAHKTAHMTSDVLYFDWFEINYARLFEASNNQLLFSYPLGDTFRYQCHGFTDDEIEVYDITTAISPTLVISPDVSGSGGVYTTTFQTTHNANARFFLAAVGDSSVIQRPVNITLYNPVDLSSAPGTDYVMITHRDFMTATQALAAYRTSTGLTTLVVDVDEVYNQFNYGIYNPIAIKNFLAYALPSYAVLVGGGHWDLRGYKEEYVDVPIYMPPNLAFVDPWQGEVDSANLLAMVVGDDPIPDLAIGRIPVEHEEELYNLIEKIQTFEAASFQDWQKNLLFVADNIPDQAGDFIASSEEVINNHLGPGYNPIRIYQNDYGCTSSSSSACEAVRHAITSTINTTGTLFVNYTGHGSRFRWSDEQILNNSHLPTLSNETQPAVFVEMTCLTGYWIYPDSDTLAVELLTLENAGAASTFSPTGLGVGQGHDALHTGFYDGIFLSGIRDLGGASIAAKLNLFQTGLSRDLMHTYTIFGDPALRLPIYQFHYFPSVFK